MILRIKIGGFKPSFLSFSLFYSNGTDILSFLEAQSCTLDCTTPTHTISQSRCATVIAPYLTNYFSHLSCQTLAIFDSRIIMRENDQSVLIVCPFINFDSFSFLPCITVCIVASCHISAQGV